MYELPKLKYSFDAFEKKNELSTCLSAKSFEYHYLKHHKSYVDNLNNLLQDKIDLKDFVTNKTNLEGVNLKIYNNAGQHLNHSFFWESITPEENSVPEKIMHLIQDSFGSFENFKEKFCSVGSALFGSGWIWIVFNKESNKLEIVPTTNADSCWNLMPLLVADVWEHAYYIDYFNKRSDFLSYIFDHFDWNFAANNLI